MAHSRHGWRKCFYRFTVFYLEPKFQTFHAENSLVKKLEPSDDPLTHQEAQLPLVFRSELRVSELIPYPAPVVCASSLGQKRVRRERKSSRYEPTGNPHLIWTLGRLLGFWLNIISIPVDPLQGRRATKTRHRHRMRFYMRLYI